MLDPLIPRRQNVKVLAVSSIPGHPCFEPGTLRGARAGDSDALVLSLRC